MHGCTHVTCKTLVFRVPIGKVSFRNSREFVLNEVQLLMRAVVCCAFPQTRNRADVDDGRKGKEKEEEQAGAGRR